MTISDKNVGVLVIMPKELKAELQEEAKTVNRSMSNYIVTILNNRPKEKDKTAN